MDNQNRRTEIKDILFRNDKTCSWLQGKLKTKGFNVDIYYLLDESRSKSFDVDIYDSIISIFKEEGIISCESERSEKLTKEIFHINAMIGHSLSMLNTTMEEFLEDDYLSFDEKRKAIGMIEGIENEFAIKISDMKKVIKK